MCCSDYVLFTLMRITGYTHDTKHHLGPTPLLQSQTCATLFPKTLLISARLHFTAFSRETSLISPFGNTPINHWANNTTSEVSSGALSPYEWQLLIKYVLCSDQRLKFCHYKAAFFEWVMSISLERPHNPPNVKDDVLRSGWMCQIRLYVMCANAVSSLGTNTCS